MAAVLDGAVPLSGGAPAAELALSLALQRPGFSLAVDLRLTATGVIALFGPSGCGKTTVLRALAGLEPAASGRVRFGELCWQDDALQRFVPPHRRAIGYVIQEAALFPHLSVQGNLRYSERRVAPGQRRIALAQAVDLLGIGHLLDRSAATLSGGERQRVAIARALLSSPRLLLMDEPLAALDAARKAEILPYLERLPRELAMPIVYVTHAMDEVARLADQLVLMDQGRVLAAGPLAALLARTDLPLAREDDAGVVVQARVAERDAAHGLARVTFDGGALWVGDAGLRPGARARVRVLARDVSVAREAPLATSILNVLPVRLLGWQLEGHTVLLRLAAPQPPGAAHLLARITRRSHEALQLQAGEALFAQVKGAALMQ